MKITNNSLIKEAYSIIEQDLDDLREIEEVEVDDIEPSEDIVDDEYEEEAPTIEERVGNLEDRVTALESEPKTTPPPETGILEGYSGRSRKNTVKTFEEKLDNAVEFFKDFAKVPEDQELTEEYIDSKNELLKRVGILKSIPSAKIRERMLSKDKK